MKRRGTFGNKSYLRATVGEVIRLTVKDKGEDVEVRIKNVLWVPEVPYRLLSTGFTR